MLNLIITPQNTLVRLMLNTVTDTQFIIYLFLI